MRREQKQKTLERGRAKTLGESEGCGFSGEKSSKFFRVDDWIDPL